MDKKIFRQNSRICFSLFFVAIISLGFTFPESQSRIKKRDAILKHIKVPSMAVDSILLTSLGAVGDSVADCKPAFEKAFQLCASKKSLRIIVPPGVYFIKGPLHLVNNITIDLQNGSRLKFSSEPTDYLPMVFTSWEGTFLYNYSPLIYGFQLKNISIIGKGIIDGNAAKTFSSWKGSQAPAQMKSREMNHAGVPFEKRLFGAGSYLRPQLIQLFECKNILIENIHITNSPFWCIHLLKSENATIRGISFNAKNVNNDGIDPEYSKNVLIENVNFDNGDDNIAIKAGRDFEGRRTAISSENIIIRNCKFKGLHAVVIGSEMSAGVRNVLVENCTASGYCKRGIYLKSNPDRGGFITDIYINNLKFTEVEDVFYATSFYHGEGKGYVTEIQRVFVDSLYCSKANHAGLVIQGFSEKKIANFNFSNVQIDSVSVGVSFNNVENINFENVNIGGVVAGMPTFAQ